MALTVKRVAKAMRKGERARIPEGSLRGLYLVVVNARNASWQLRYQLNHAQHWMGLGSAHEVSLDEARDKTRQIRAQLREKHDPMAARRAACGGPV